MKPFLLLAPLMFLLLACNTDDDVTPTPPTGDVFIRIENASTVLFEDILVNTDADYNYGNLAIGALTEYQEHGAAYSYAYVSLDIDEIKHVIQPIDYVGETMLAPGNYTYILTFDETVPQLFIELRED